MYVELQAKSNFSFLRGASHPEELIEHACELGYSAIGVCDVNTLAGIVRAHAAGKKYGIRSIAGAQLALYQTIPERLDDEETVAPEVLAGRWESLLDNLSLIAYPTSKKGYGSLSQLLTLGKSRAPKSCCYLKLEDVLENLKECAVIACLTDLSLSTVKEQIKRLLSTFGREFLSLAIKNNYGPDQKKNSDEIISLSKALSLPLVVTNDVYFHDPDRQQLQDVITCIRRGHTIERAGFELFQNAERYLKSPKEMTRLFRHFPEALRRTVEITEQTSSFSLDQLKYEYPIEICPSGKSPMDYLRELTWKGAHERYPIKIPDTIINQIKHEFKLVEELDYAKYFLTVYDIVLFARSREILCQGRGAAANSVICYCLGITAVNPREINLLFERFISKERNEPPDIDIDFEHERREEVIQYIYEKYGRHRAALVAEVVTYRTKSSIREIGKVFGLELETIEKLIRVVTRFDENRTLREQVEGLNLNLDDRRIRKTLSLFKTLVGFPRHLSQHVGGFVISETPLSEFVPIENASMEGRTVIEWDKDDVDAMGMLKIDCLALGMLTCIRKAFSMIGGGELYKIPQDDQAVYDMICRADTIGVFQIESRAQMSMLPRLKPRCYYDLVIEVAIVRPGPIQGGMVHPFLKRRKEKKKIGYPSTIIGDILGPTLGVPIFQEQAMQLVIHAAGFTPGEADQLRRAMASWKKNKNALGPFEKRIISGMLNQGYTQEFAEQCCNQIKGFGEYGFPQSHSASFALLVYVSSWLKHHHPAAFCAALINSQPMGFYQPAQILQDAERHGVEIRPIDINFSDWNCTLEKTHSGKPAVRIGMRLVRGLSENQVLQILKVREKKFENLSSLWKKTRIPAGVLRTLAKGDAFQSLGLTRQQALWEIQRLKDHSLPLIERIEHGVDTATLPKYSDEKEMLIDYSHSGFSIKNHPLSFYREELNKRGVVTVKDLNGKIRNGVRILLAGIVIIRQRPPTASGFVFLTVEDETGSANLIFKPNIYSLYRDVIYDSVYLLVQGKVQKQDGVTNLMVEKARNLRPEGGEEVDLSRNFR